MRSSVYRNLIRPLLAPPSASRAATGVQHKQQQTAANNDHSFSQLSLIVGRAEYSSVSANDALEAWRSQDFGTFSHTELSIEKARRRGEKPSDWDNLVFGRHFSDHMLAIPWSAADGWGKPKIYPLQDLCLHPAAKVFHYAIELFEGMKAYRGVDNHIRIFRPDLNMKRMNLTSARACLPTFDGEELLKCIEELILLDQEWVPYSTSSSLYIRPTFIGTDSTIGIGWSEEALLFVLTGPVGAYYPTGLKPISLLADTSFVRAFKGGSGNTKMGCNYAPTILIGKIAADAGCQQVLWLYGQEQYITEVGTMNIFLFLTNENGEKELVTPPLESGLILPGVTRQSLLDLAREWGEFKVSERDITMVEVLKSLKENRLHEMFGAGTACIVSPVSQILYKYDGKEEYLHIPTMEQNPCQMQRFFDALTDIQYGRLAKAEWTRVIDPAAKK